MFPFILIFIAVLAAMLTVLWILSLKPVQAALQAMLGLTVLITIVGFIALVDWLLLHG